MGSRGLLALEPLPEKRCVLEGQPAAAPADAGLMAGSAKVLGLRKALRLDGHIITQPDQDIWEQSVPPTRLAGETQERGTGQATGYSLKRLTQWNRLSRRGRQPLHRLCPALPTPPHMLLRGPQPLGPALLLARKQ